jgi:hypothetical protein
MPRNIKRGQKTNINLEPNQPDITNDNDSSIAKKIEKIVEEFVESSSELDRSFSKSNDSISFSSKLPHDKPRKTTIRVIKNENVISLEESTKEKVKIFLH